jgi:protein gp37
MHPDWARSLRDQCAAAGVPFLFKQWGEWLAGAQDGESVSLTFHDKDHVGPDNPQWLQHDGIHYAKVGKKAAGRLLDGRTHDEFPKGAA